MYQEHAGCQEHKDFAQRKNFDFLSDEFLHFTSLRCCGEASSFLKFDFLIYKLDCQSFTYGFIQSVIAFIQYL